MTKFVHIVYVHPVEQGKPNLHKVKREEEFADFHQAMRWIRDYNLARSDDTQAVYLGCVNDATGELV
jgi:hypothetical protein